MTSVYVHSFIVALVLTSTAAFERRAIVTLYKGNETVGTIEFVQRRLEGHVKVIGKLNGLPEGVHGFHIHDKGDVSAGCNNVGDHFNPEIKFHGAPNDTERHVGDLGNIQVGGNGSAEFNTTDRLISLGGPHSIIGRSLVVHEDADDLGRGSVLHTKTTGNAGAKIACGVIGIQSPITPWEKADASTIWKSASALLLFVVVATVLM